MHKMEETYDHVKKYLLQLYSAKNITLAGKQSMYYNNSYVLQ